MKLRDLFENQHTLAETLANRCSQYLNAPGAHAGFLFRGLRGHVAYEVDNGLNWTVLTARRNRTPSDTPVEYSTLAGDFFMEKFGWDPRLNGTFTTSSFKEARGYGTPHAFFPIGTFRYIWSPEVKDLYISLYHELITKNRDIHQDEDADHAKFTKAIQEAGYINWGLSKAIATGNEIMFDCEQYLVVSCGRGSTADPDVLNALSDLTDIEP